MAPERSHDILARGNPNDHPGTITGTSLWALHDVPPVLPIRRSITLRRRSTMRCRFHAHEVSPSAAPFPDMARSMLRAKSDPEPSEPISSLTDLLPTDDTRGSYQLIDIVGVLRKILRLAFRFLLACIYISPNSPANGISLRICSMVHMIFIPLLRFDHIKL